MSRASLPAVTLWQVSSRLGFGLRMARSLEGAEGTASLNAASVNAIHL